MFTDLHEDVLACIIDLLDVYSCVALSNTCKFMKAFFENHYPNKPLCKKLQPFLIELLYRIDCQPVQLPHFFTKNIMNYMLHAAHNLYAIKNANKIKDEMLVELLFKSTDLPSTGINMLPPVSSSGETDIDIHHWYCFEISDSRYIFLFSTSSLLDSYRMGAGYTGPFVSAVSHCPVFLEESSSYYAVKNDPLCDWDSMRPECCTFTTSGDPDSYLTEVAEMMKNLFADDERKINLVTPQLLHRFLNYNITPWEYSDEDVHQYNEKELETRIKFYNRTVLKSLEDFLFSDAYGKCFNKQKIVKYGGDFKMFFECLTLLMDSVPTEEFIKTLKSMINLIRPSEIVSTCFKRNCRQDLFSPEEIPIVLDLLKRVGDSECKNTEENYVLYLRTGVRLDWHYSYTFPFVNRLQLNGETIVSFMYDRNNSQEPSDFPPDNQVRTLEKRIERQVEFQELWDRNTTFNLPQLKVIFDCYSQQKFDEAPEISLNFISRFFGCLTNCPFYQSHITTHNFWEATDTLPPHVEEDPFAPFNPLAPPLNPIVPPLNPIVPPLDPIAPPLDPIEAPLEHVAPPLNPNEPQMNLVEPQLNENEPPVDPVAPPLIPIAPPLIADVPPVDLIAPPLDPLAPLMDPIAPPADPNEPSMFSPAPPLVPNEPLLGQNEPPLEPNEPQVNLVEPPFEQIALPVELPLILVAPPLNQNGPLLNPNAPVFFPIANHVEPVVN